MSTELHPAPVPPSTDPSGPPTAARSGEERRGVYVEPARRLSPEPGGGRGWRTVTVIVSLVVTGIAVLGLAASTIVPWAVARSYDDVPATIPLGAPSSLTLDADVADVRVVRSAEAQEVVVALVEDGSTELPGPDESARAMVRQSGTEDSPELTISEPVDANPIPWISDSHDLLVIIPDSLEIALDLSSDVGGIEADGSYSSLRASTSVGDIDLRAITSTGEVVASTSTGSIELELGGASGDVSLDSSIGDVDLVLSEESANGIDITAETGDVSVRAPGSSLWDVDAQSDLGEVDIDRSLIGAGSRAAGTMTLRTSVGDILVTR